MKDLGLNSFGICLSLASFVTVIGSSSLKNTLVADYDETLSPGFYGDSPVEVLVQLLVESFGNIHEADMEFQVFSYFIQSWTDNRLAGKLNRSITLKGGDIDLVWTPDAYCYNARATNLMLPNLETHSKVSISPEGDLVYSRGVSFTASCVMDLRSFPHDSQTCHLKFGSYAYDDSDVIFKWKNSDVHVSRDNMAQFQFMGASFTSNQDSYLNVNFTTITVSYTFKRRLGYYLLQVFVPDILIVLISWIVFWMSPDSAGDRLTIGITTILTIMFLSGAINASMPPVSYAKALDWYLLVSFGFIFFSVIESLVVFLLSSRPLGKDCNYNKDEMIRHSIKSKLLPCVKYQKRKARIAKHKVPDEDQATEMNIMVKDKSLPMSLEDIVTMEDKARIEEGMRRSKITAVRIDQISRVLFPLSFASYTFGYWLTYS